MEIFAYLKRYSFFYFFIEIVRTFIVSPKDTAHMTVSRFAFFLCVSHRFEILLWSLILQAIL